MELTIMRGLSGSGKSTWANYLAQGIICSADDFRGLYEPAFDPKKLSAAHAWCRAKFDQAIRNRMSIVLDNTNTMRWEWLPYAEAARAAGYLVKFAVIYDGGFTDEELAVRNRHGVPVEAIRAQRARWEWDMAFPHEDRRPVLRPGVVNTAEGAVWANIWHDGMLVVAFWQEGPLWFWRRLDVGGRLLARGQVEAYSRVEALQKAVSRAVRGLDEAEQYVANAAAYLEEEVRALKAYLEKEVTK